MDNQTVVVPHIEDDVPIPKNAKEALPNMSTQEELEARTNTIKMLADIQDENIEPSKENMEEAEILAEEMMANPELKPDFGSYPNETIAFLAGMVAQTSHMVAKDLADIKLTVLNGLLQEATMAKSSRERIAALKAVGEIDGVDAFKRKTEVTHITKSGDELEKELLATINELKGKVIHTKEVVEVEDIEVDDD
jgi:HEAT repeat protein|tara:strand:+ start:389 stop:970 length:582 start_codon:yes stop_codon:yes gene_type:complete